MKIIEILSSAALIAIVSNSLAGGLDDDDYHLLRRIFQDENSADLSWVSDSKRNELLAYFRQCVKSPDKNYFGTLGLLAFNDEATLARLVDDYHQDEKLERGAQDDLRSYGQEGVLAKLAPDLTNGPFTPRKYLSSIALTSAEIMLAVIHRVEAFPPESRLWAANFGRRARNGKDIRNARLVGA